MAKYHVSAVRTYYSYLDFEVVADSKKEAEVLARQMIDDCVMEFHGIDLVDDTDEIDVWYDGESGLTCQKVAAWMIDRMPFYDGDAEYDMQSFDSLTDALCEACDNYDEGFTPMNYEDVKDWLHDNKQGIAQAIQDTGHDVDIGNESFYIFFTDAEMEDD